MKESLIVLLTILSVGTQPTQGLTDKSIGLCDQPWFPVYEHDPTGWEMKGSRRKLLEHIENGYLCKVVFTTPTDLVSLPLDEFHLRGFDVCGTTAWILSDDGTKIDDDADWLPTVACTSGQINRLNFTSSSWERSVDSGSVNVTGNMVWYTKPTSCDPGPVYSHYFDGSAVSGSLPKLIKLARASGLGVRMRDRGYYFQSQNTQTYNNKLVTVQSLNHLSLKHTMGGMQHNDDPYYEWHGGWSSDGRRDVSRWFINSTKLWSHENEQVALDWFGDECWRKVMAVSKNNGDVIYGSLEELVMMIELGHMVRVYFDGFSLKTGNVRMVDGGVVAMTTEEFARRGGYPGYNAPFFNSQARIIYRLIHSSGTVRTYIFTISDYKITETSAERPAVAWYVDTRPWRQVYQTLRSGEAVNGTNATTWVTTTGGDSQVLLDAVNQGATVRIGVREQFSEGQVFLDLDSIRTNLDTNETIAQSVKSVSIQKPEGANDYTIPDKISQLSFLITSGGVASSRKFNMVSRELLINYVSNTANITWFVNM